MLADLVLTERDASELDHLRRTETIIARLRWLGIASWAFILQGAELTASPWVVYAVYGACVAYAVVTQRLARRSSSIRRTAIASTAGDAVIVTAICLVTGGLRSDFYPYFYLTIPATAMRFGVRETFVAFAWHAALSVLIFRWAAHPTPRRAIWRSGSSTALLDANRKPVEP